MIFISLQRNKGGNRDYCSHFPVIFEISKFLIVFVQLVFGKVRFDGVTGPGRDMNLV